MNSILLVFIIIIGILCTSYSEDVQHPDNRGLMAVAVTPIEENKADIGGSSNSGLSSDKLSEIYDLAKNISHSKGVYRETTKSGDEGGVRRSILKRVAVVSESNAMRAILQAFESDENKLQLLENLEGLVHQYDVAVNFAASGGIKIVTPYLFSPDDEIAVSAATVLGIAMQSNPSVQKFAMNQDVSENLMKLLTHKSADVISRAIFALGSLLRNLPEAQAEFIAVNGFSKLADILQNPGISSYIKLKIINLCNDLAAEQETEENYPCDKSLLESDSLKRLLDSEMQKKDICKVVASFLNLEDYDTHEKVISAMNTLHNACYSYFKSEIINNRLKQLLKIYDPAVEDRNPVYPVIDKDLKRALYCEIKKLIKKIKKETDSESFDSSSKADL